MEEDYYEEAESTAIGCAIIFAGLTLLAGLVISVISYFILA